jgi:hypothetical protein
MLAGISAAWTGTGKITSLFAIGSYVYGIYSVITLIFRLPVIGGCFPKVDDVVHGRILLCGL